MVECAKHRKHRRRWGSWPPCMWIFDPPRWVLTGCLCLVCCRGFLHCRPGVDFVVFSFPSRSVGNRRHIHALTKSGRKAGDANWLTVVDQIVQWKWMPQWMPKPETAPGPSQLFVDEERLQMFLVMKYSDANGEDAKEKKKEAENKLRQLDEYFEQSYADLDKYPVPDFLSSDYGKGKINMAVTGASGVGKSSFINAIRRVKAKDTSAAKTGVLETTMEPAKFDFPMEKGFLGRMSEKVKNLLNPEDDPIQAGDILLFNGKQVRVIQKSNTGARLTVEVIESGQTMKVERSKVTGKLSDCNIWDLPGTGTPTFPQATYLRAVGIRHFDLVVLLTATRFTEAEMLLMQELKRWKVPFFLVRTKVDVDVQCEMELLDEYAENGVVDEEVEDDTIEVIKQFFRRNYDEDVYCVSSKPRFRSKYDFLRLETEMEEKIKSQRLVLRRAQSDKYSNWSGWNLFR